MRIPRRLKVITTVVFLLTVVAIPVPTLALEGQSMEHPQGLSQVCTGVDTSWVPNFCNFDFEEGDTSLCFTGSFPASLTPGETFLRLLGNSNNFRIVDVLAGNSYFEMTFQALNDDDRNFSATFEMTFTEECGGQPVTLPSMCAVSFVYDFNSGAPETDWSSQTQVNGRNSDWPPLYLDNPSVLTIDITVSYGDSYSQRPVFILNFQIGPTQPGCDRPSFQMPLVDLPNFTTGPAELPKTGPTSSGLPLAVFLIFVGLLTLTASRRCPLHGIRS